MFKYLSIAALINFADATKYRSGEVKTSETFTYGKFKARIKQESKLGSITSFFIWWDGPNWSKAGWNELDVELVPSVKANPFSTNLIWKGQ